MAAVLQGVSAIYGCGGTTVANAVVQSYSNDGEFNNELTIVDADGKTITWRGDDRKTQISVELIAKTSAIPQLGASFSITVNTASSYAGGAASTAFSGWVQKVSEKGSNRGYSAVTVTAVGYEAIAS